MPTTVMVAMDVHVGVCSNPNIVSGYANFNDHTFTDTEDTVYYYNMKGEGEVYESLRQFSSFSS
jgi:hypothetical protein